MRKSSKDWVFSRGVMQDKETVYILSFFNDNSDEPIDLTQVLQWRKSLWGYYDIEWQAIDLCCYSKSEPTVISVGPYGDVNIATSKGFVSEHIDMSEEGPEGRGIIRCVQQIGDGVYATGMGRQVYKRNFVDDVSKSTFWQRIDKGVVQPLLNDEISGFNSINGISEEEIYCVGWNGEIWLFENKAWEKINSPTNVKLEHLLHDSYGIYYAVGQCGVIVRGKQKAWEIIPQEITTEQFWGGTYFHNTLWVATSSNVYYLDKDDQLILVEIYGEKITTGWLESKDGVIWSIGSNHLFYSFDGIKWNQIILDDKLS